jgi:hypothetical protein
MKRLILHELFYLRIRAFHHHLGLIYKHVPNYQPKMERLNINGSDLIRNKIDNAAIITFPPLAVTLIKKMLSTYFDSELN